MVSHLSWFILWYFQMQKFAFPIQLDEYINTLQSKQHAEKQVQTYPQELLALNLFRQSEYSKEKHT